MYEILPSDWATLFSVIGIMATVGFVTIIGAFVYFDLKERVLKFINIKYRQNTDNCCPKCGAYTPYFKTKNGTKWRCIDYCPSCGYNMLDERLHKHEV